MPNDPKATVPAQPDLAAASRSERALLLYKRLLIALLADLYRVRELRRRRTQRRDKR